MKNSKGKGGKEDLIHKVTFKQRPKGDEGA